MYTHRRTKSSKGQKDKRTKGQKDKRTKGQKDKLLQNHRLELNPIKLRKIYNKNSLNFIITLPINIS